MRETQVVIVGAGPVGLTLAVDLGRRGVRCVLVEQKPQPEFLPKMERCNARTMELYRRIGLSDQIRAAGLPADVPMDVYVVLSMVETPLLHLPYPSVAAMREQLAATHDGSQPAEPYQLVSQYTIEPLLKSVAEGLRPVTVLYGHECLELQQDAGSVSATVRAPGGNTAIVRADYLVGCDGGSSLVRRQLGIKLRGEGNLLKLRQALYRCDDLFARLPVGAGPGRGRHYHVADNQASFLIMQDSTRHWTLHAVVGSDEAMKAQFEKVVAMPVEYEMLYCGEWRQNLLLADRYGEGRVFLAGDAVHLVIPTGGLGMNTGVADALDLSWKLAGTLQGWGGPNLLRSYEIERRQVGERNVGASRYASLGRRKWRSQWRPEIRDATLAGQAARDNLARVADMEQRKTNEMIGAEMGYRYVDSPIIDNIPGGPEHLFREYRPTTWPGARLPHLWMPDGTAIQDHIPDTGYALLRLRGTYAGNNAGKNAGNDADSGAIEAAFRQRGAPIHVLEVHSEAAREVYGFDFLLLRPDLHVVWRANSPPADPAALAALATGF